MRRRSLIVLVCSACSAETPARVELEPLPSQLGCADDTDPDASGIQVRVGVIVRGDRSDEYDRFAIENSTTDLVIEGRFVEGGGEVVGSFAASHNALLSYAFDDDGGLPTLFGDRVNVLACCEQPCRE